MSHTAKVIAAGLVLLALFVLVGRPVGAAAPASGMAVAARWFIPAWLAAAGVNMWSRSWWPGDSAAPSAAR